MLHTVKASLGEVLEVKENSKVKAVRVMLETLFLHLKMPTFNKLTELSVGMKIQVEA